MIKKRQLIALAMLVSIFLSASPASVILYGQAQTQGTPEEKLVELADRAEQQVKDIITIVYANETALQQIKDFDFLDELEGNVTLFDEGVGNLTAANAALAITDYDVAVAYTTEALRIFREVFSSINVIIEAAGLQKGHLIDNQGLLEAITRDLQRIYWLRAILPEDVPLDIKQLIADVAALLDINAAKALLLEGKETEVMSSLQEARLLISQVYQYLKEEGEESDTWRILRYCERVQERIRERFNAGNQSGVDFTAVLESLGYQTENQFMETLQNMIQTAQGKTDDFKNVLQDLEVIGQTVQEMDQALMQEMQRHQGANGSTGGDGGYGSGGMGSSGSGSGSSSP